jgi:amino acid adenylation domain-containing protein
VSGPSAIDRQPLARRAGDGGARDESVQTGGIEEERSAGAGVTMLVHEQFRLRAEQAPLALAVKSGQEALSYGEVNERAEALADRLRSLGAGPEVLVGLCLPRSAAMVVGALGILKSGGAYLPLDPADPILRLGFMLEDAGVDLIVTDRSLSARPYAANRSVIALDDCGRVVEIFARGRNTFGQEPGSGARGLPAASTNGASRSLAYVIYTSGSTGTPKGVEVIHESLVNLVQWHQGAFRVSAKDRASLLAKVGFDAGVWELWPYLAAGASLRVPEEEKLNNPLELQQWLLAEGITICFVPTPIAERLLSLRWPSHTSLRVMLTGGDALHAHSPPGLPFLLVNNYGPTECTVVATSGPVPTGDPTRPLPPIGRPISNTQVYILDDSLAPATAGKPGEIYIGGAGVARGYRNHPELTAERFVSAPFDGASGRLFKTGDFGQSLPDGQIAFLGRRDEQIKIRGFRVEPNEIVAALDRHPGVAESVVVAREITTGDRHLVAYLVAAPGARPSRDALREFLGTLLPVYMVPAVFVVLNSLPLTPNGKVDRAALPAPQRDNTLGEEAIRVPETELERLVAGILAPLLGLDQVDVEANFFSLGGHSLLGIQLISRLRACLGVELSLRAVFEAPSVAALSAEIERLLQARIAAMSEEEVQRALISESSR